MQLTQELGIPYTLVPAMPRSPQATKLNPSGKVPALQAGVGVRIAQRTDMHRLRMPYPVRSMATL